MSRDRGVLVPCADDQLRAAKIERAGPVDGANGRGSAGELLSEIERAAGVGNQSRRIALGAAGEGDCGTRAAAGSTIGDQCGMSGVGSVDEPDGRG